jgi:hypothetical protein
MNYFSSLVASFCAASVFIGGLYMLCPDGVMSRSVKYIFSLIFILSVVTAASFSGNWDIGKLAQVSVEINDEELQKSSAEYVFETALKKEGIDFSKITVCTDKTENDSISISKVIIYTDCEKLRVISALKEVAENTEVEVIND